MNRIHVLTTAHKFINDWSTPASNPFENGSTMHANPDGPTSMAWLIAGYPDPGPAIFSGDIVLGHSFWQGELELTVSIDQGGWTKATQTFKVSQTTPNRYGVAFNNDGSPYWVTYVLRLLTPEHFQGAVCGVFPIQCIMPLSRVAEPNFFSVTTAGDDALVAVNQGGLMNRLACVLSCIHLADAMGRRAMVWWGRNKHCAAAFDELFECTRSDPSIIAADYVRYFGNAEAPPLDTTLASKHILIDAVEPIAATIPYGYIDLGAAFMRLRLAEPVANLLARYDSIDFSRVLGLHIRRPYASGAFADQEQAKFHLDPVLFSRIVSSCRDLNGEVDAVLVCTNDPAEADALLSEFGDFVIIPPKTSVDNSHNPRALQEALVDCLLLSRCPTLISPSTTMFGMMAHAISDNNFFALLPDSTPDSIGVRQYHHGELSDTLYVPASALAESVLGSSSRTEE